jgi:ferric-dicitrate binding protein FerR (iron transport regulator)
MAAELEELEAGRRQTRDLAVPRPRGSATGAPMGRGARWLRIAAAVVFVAAVALLVVMVARR